MADAEKSLALPVTDGWQVFPVDADNTAVVFKAGEHTNGAILSNDALSAFAGSLLNSAIKHSEAQNPRLEDGEQITAIPIPVVGLAVTPGRAETEAILTLRCGNLTLAFAAEAAMIRDMCMGLVPKLRPLGPSTSH